MSFTPLWQMPAHQDGWFPIYVPGTISPLYHRSFRMSSTCTSSTVNKPSTL